VRGGFVRLDGLHVHHVYGGAGSPAVLFVHGLGSAGYLEWRFNLPVIGRAHRVYAPDLPGFGRSDRPPDGYGIPLFARVIEEYIRARRLRPVLVGTSMGGRVALEVALRRPESVRKLVLVNALGVVRPNVQLFYPLVLLPRVGEGLVGVVREALHRLPPRAIRRFAGRFLGIPGDIERILDDRFLAALREMHAAEGYPRAYVSTVRSLAKPDAYLTDSLVDRLAGTGLPVLLIWGEGDRLLPLARAREAHRRLSGARLVVIEGAGHAPQSERPDAFNRALGDFLADRGSSVNEI
jgi:pimeloyl-ACP methyl ester carboxylesterase